MIQKEERQSMDYHYGSQMLHMIFFLIIITFFLVVSFHCTHIMIDTESPAAASFTSAQYFSRSGLNLNEVSLKSSWDGGGNYIGMIARENGNEEENGSSLGQKFRFLLGLKSYFQRKPRNGPSESDAQSPSPAPAPSPVHVYPYRHSHPSNHYPRIIPTAPMIHKKERGKSTRRIIIASAVSAGVGSLLCAILLFFGCKKLRKKRKKPAKNLSIYCSAAGNSAKKIRSDPEGPDLFYLESLGAELEPQLFFLRQNTVTTLNACSRQNIPYCALAENPESEQKVEDCEVDNIEIEEIKTADVQIPESIIAVEPVPDEGCNNTSSSDNVIPDDAACAHDSSDDSDDDADESFHSICNSQSSEQHFYIRSSNASADSCLEFLDTISQTDSQEFGYSIASPSHLRNPSSCSASTSETNQKLNRPEKPAAAPPPPPPPPPSTPPQVSFLRKTPSPSTSSSTRETFKGSSSSALSNVSSPGISGSSLGSDQTPRKNSSPISPHGISSPPCPPPPPPFVQGSSISLKFPPPPPSLVSQTALGKDGTPLPKLKPLHWDKVRAAPGTVHSLG